MTTTDYVPIDCDQHSELELLAMRHTSVVVRASAVADDEAEFSTRGELQDVLTRDGAEYLELREPDGSTVSVRLDRLLSLTAPDGAPVWRQKSAMD